MRKTINILMVLALITLFSACSKNRPPKVAKAFLTALYKMEYDSAKTFCTKDSYGYIEYRRLLESYTFEKEKKQSENIGINIINTKITGDNAECKYKITGVPDEEGTEQTIDLIKKDGKWLVDLHAENLDFNKVLPQNDTISDKPDTTAIVN